jgi:hypothetical protein
MALLNVPPETMWPTGKTPAELAAALHAEGKLTPEEVNQRMAAAHNGAEPYKPPPRPVLTPEDHRALEQERLVMVQTPPPAPQPVRHQAPSYHFPLSTGVAVEIIIHGTPSPADYRLLGRYVRLMSTIEPAPPPRAEPVLRRTGVDPPPMIPKRSRR